jgi:hypothetical protein
VRWSISVRADGDRPLEREEIVELADAVATWSGIASGIGTTSYAAQMIIEAATSDEAVDQAVEVFKDAAARAGLPPWPVAWAESVSEESEFEEFG